MQKKGDKTVNITSGTKNEIILLYLELWYMANVYETQNRYGLLNTTNINEAHIECQQQPPQQWEQVTGHSGENVQ